MSIPAKQLLTEAEYLALDREAEMKSEFYNGEMLAMAGGTYEHSLIGSNLVRELGARLKGGPCQVHGSDLRLKSEATGLYTYADVTVVCGEPRFLDDRRDTLLNPTLVIEVLSSSTEAYDRGRKFYHYSDIESVREYLLVAQDCIMVERFQRREPEEEWLFTAYRQVGSSVALDSVGCEVPLVEIYDQVRFPPR